MVKKQLHGIEYALQMQDPSKDDPSDTSQSHIKQTSNDPSENPVSPEELNSTEELSETAQAWDLHFELIKSWLPGVVFGEELRERFAGSVAVISSHVTRRNFELPSWQAKMRSALRYSKEREGVVIINSLSPYALVLERACKLFEVDCVLLTLMDLKSKRTESDLSEFGRLSGSTWNTRQEYSVDLSLVPPQFLFHGKSALLDRFMVAFAEQVFVLDMRQGGKVHGLVLDRVRDLPDVAGVKLVRMKGDQVVSFDEIEPVQWIVTQTDNHTTSIEPSTDDEAADKRSDDNSPRLTNTIDTRSLISPSGILVPSKVADFLRLSAILDSGCGDLDGQFLTHCTRAREGAWPDQSEEEYLDELIANGGFSPPTVLETLLKILQDKRIVATKTRKPGDFASVSFTELPLPTVLHNRKFQRHLGRWDWEPYGIMISTDALQRLGALPVEYRTKAQMIGLSMEQLRCSQVYSDDPRKQDWRAEREWRLFRDCDLNEIEAGEAMVFVPTGHDAEQIAPYSNWPIVITSQA